jgi:hypothetical protein
VGAIVAYLSGYYQFSIRPYVPWFTPILAWVWVSKAMRSYFRLQWFWWISGAFVICSGLLVSASFLARAGLFLWVLILWAEAICFGALVKSIASTLFGDFEDE